MRSCREKGNKCGERARSKECGEGLASAERYDYVEQIGTMDRSHSPFQLASLSLRSAATPPANLVKPKGVQLFGVDGRYAHALSSRQHPRRTTLAPGGEGARRGQGLSSRLIECVRRGR